MGGYLRGSTIPGGDLRGHLGSRCSEVQAATLNSLATLNSSPWGSLITETRFACLQVQMVRGQATRPAASAFGGAALPCLPSFSSANVRQQDAPRWGSGAEMAQPISKSQKKKEKQRQKQQQAPRPQVTQPYLVPKKGKGHGKGGKGKKGTHIPRQDTWVGGQRPYYGTLVKVSRGGFRCCFCIRDRPPDGTREHWSRGT